jgi:DNA primase
VAYYHETLKQSPEARAYLERRGLTHPELIDRFKLGFSNRTLSYRLPLGTRATGARIREKLQALGVIRDTGHEHFAGSVVIPIFASDGTVAQMYGRKITPNLHSGTALHLYLRGPLHGVLNLEGLAGNREVILCEALIDALTFWCAGFRNVTASFGTGGFTQDHLSAFKSLGVERVLIAYDRDEAGEKAAQALAPRLAAEGIESLQVLFPKGMDANDYACRVKPAEKSLELVLSKAVPFRPAQDGPQGELPGQTTLALTPPASTDEPRETPPAASTPRPTRATTR